MQNTSINNNVIQIEGRLTFNTVMSVLKEVKPLLMTSASNVSVDLARLDGADSASLALLCEMERLAKHQGQSIQFLNPPAQLKELADAYNMKDILSIS